MLLSETPYGSGYITAPFLKSEVEFLLFFFFDFNSRLNGETTKLAIDHKCHTSAPCGVQVTDAGEERIG